MSSKALKKQSNDSKTSEESRSGNATDASRSKFPLFVLIMAILLGIAWYQRENSILNTSKPITTAENAPTIVHESEHFAQQNIDAIREEHASSIKKAASSSGDKESAVLQSEAVQSHEEKVEERSDSETIENEQLGEEFIEKCKIGRGGVPKVPSYEGKIDVIQGKPETDFFYEKYVRPGKPVVIKNAMNDWTALEKWTDAYLNEKIGDKLMKVERSYSREFGFLADEQTKWSFHNMTFKNFSDVYLTPKPKDKNAVWEHYYLDSGLMPEIKDDVHLPDWIPCLYDEPPPFYRYENVWMGGGEEVSLLHNDWEDNLLHVVSGYKVFTLIDPKTPSEYLYEIYDDKVTETKLSPANPTDPDVLTKYPLFANANPIQVLLEPGDVLFIPALYWHQVNSYCRHISVNVWWDTHAIRDITEYMYHHKTADCIKRLRRRLPVCKWKRRKDKAN